MRPGKNQTTKPRMTKRETERKKNEIDGIRVSGLSEVRNESIKKSSTKQ